MQSQHSAAAPTEPRDFLGQWLLTRRIEDHKARAVGQFEGRASLIEGGAAWHYHEQGRLVFAGAAPMQAERRYLWRPDALDIDIHFEDGRFFHRLDLQGDQPVHHWCDPDSYRVSYDFAQWPEWRARWRVQGPRKDYTLENRYVRA